jgi:hypothetical protein
VARGLDRTGTRSTKGAERGGGPHFADPVRNEWFFLRGGSGTWGFCGHGAQQRYAPAKSEAGSRTRPGTMHRAPAMEWFDREVKTNEDRGGSECGRS